MQERVFNQVAKLVEVLVIGPLVATSFLRRNDGTHPLPGGLLNNRIGVIPFISDEMPRINALDQLCSLRAISCGTLSDKESDRHTKRIHGQMELCVEPPFVRLMS